MGIKIITLQVPIEQEWRVGTLSQVDLSQMYLVSCQLRFIMYSPPDTQEFLLELLLHDLIVKRYWTVKQLFCIYWDNDIILARKSACCIYYTVRVFFLSWKRERLLYQISEWLWCLFWVCNCLVGWFPFLGSPFVVILTSKVCFG